MKKRYELVPYYAEFTREEAIERFKEINLPVEYFERNLSRMYSDNAVQVGGHCYANDHVRTSFDYVLVRRLAKFIYDQKADIDKVHLYVCSHCSLKGPKFFQKNNIIKFARLSVAGYQASFWAYLEPGVTK